MQKQDFETYQKHFRDFKILLKFSETHVFRGTIRHPCLWHIFFASVARNGPLPAEVKFRENTEFFFYKEKFKINCWWNK